MEQENKEIIIDDVDVVDCPEYVSKESVLMPFNKIKVIKDYCYSCSDTCRGHTCDYKDLKKLQYKCKVFCDKILIKYLREASDMGERGLGYNEELKEQDYFWESFEKKVLDHAKQILF